ncbi:UNVERIFIED_CONTAM: hypothetical protein FKN15_036318 [Acipenser sinensis]
MQGEGAGREGGELCPGCGAYGHTLAICPTQYEEVEHEHPAHRRGEREHPAPRGGSASIQCPEGGSASIQRPDGGSACIQCPEGGSVSIQRPEGGGARASSAQRGGTRASSAQKQGARVSSAQGGKPTGPDPRPPAAEEEYLLPLPPPPPPPGAEQLEPHEGELAVHEEGGRGQETSSPCSNFAAGERVAGARSGDQLPPQQFRCRKYCGWSPMKGSCQP